MIMQGNGGTSPAGSRPADPGQETEEASKARDSASRLLKIGAIVARMLAIARPPNATMDRGPAGPRP